jgi:hypothetical protein
VFVKAFNAMPTSVSCTNTDGSFTSSTPTCDVYDNGDTWYIEAYTVVTGLTTYTLIVTGITNGDMSDTTTGFYDDYNGDYNFGSC